MTQELVAGDVVRLKSGGPDMTVEEVANFEWGGDRMKAKCKWFEGKQLKEEVFELTSLEKIAR